MRAVERTRGSLPECRCRQSRRRRRAFRPAAARAAALGAASVTVIAASMQSPIRLVASPPTARDGRSTDDDRDAGRVDVGDDGFESMPASGAFEPGAEDGVDDQRAVARPRRSAAPTLCSSAISTTVTPRRPRISRLVRASPRTSATAADHEDRRVDAALQQRSRDDEPVAAVVAAAAQARPRGVRASVAA